MFLIIAGSILIIVTLGVLESFLHGRALAKIPVRIHINGTRGKSSVTRLLAGALREAGKVTCAKTTGTLARFITPTGREYPIYRPGGANVGEQVRIVRLAASYKPDVLVIECMALQPSFQWMSEKRFVQATHGIITNARPDHLDVMGPEPRDVALALAGMTPRGGILFTAERDLLDVFEMSSRDRGAKLVGIGEADVEDVTEKDLEPFSYNEHAENVALVIKVCESLGVDRETALRGMWSAPPDIGVLKAFPVNFHGRRLLFVNAFAANDPTSTGRIWESMLARYPQYRRKIALLNCRADRPDRSFQLGEAILDWTAADDYLLVGSGTHAFAKAAAERGLDTEKIHFAEGKGANEIFEIMVDLCGHSGIIIGMGNIGGPGLDILRHVKNRSTLVAVEEKEAAAQADAAAAAHPD